MNEHTAIQKPFRVLVVTGVYPTPQIPHKGTFVKSQVDSLIAAGLDIDVLLPRPGPSPLRYARAFAQVFLSSLSRRYDVIHGQYGLWCLVARLQWTTPVVASYWGDDVLGTFTADGGHSSKGNFVTKVSRGLSYLVGAVIVKSEQMKKVLRGAQHKVFVIPNGVDFAQFRPVPRTEVRATLGWDQQRYYVLFANNPAIPVKNYALAQAAVELVREKGKDVELVVANGLPHATVTQYMNACNALILSSRAEGSPNVVKEAMACNVPVVATDVGDVAAVIGHTEGCSVCAQNAEELAAGLEKALAHTERTTGREDMRHLDSAVIAQKVIAVYELATGKGVNVANAEQRQQGPEAPGNSIKEEMYAKET